MQEKKTKILAILFGTMLFAASAHADDTLSIRLVSGSTSALIGSTQREPFVVEVTDEGQPVPGADVEWALSDAQGRIFAEQDVTDAQGRQEATWIAGSQPRQTIRVTAEKDGVSGTLEIPVQAHSVERPWGAISTHADFYPDNPDEVRSYRITVVPLTDPEGTYYEAIGWKGSYAGLQRCVGNCESATLDKQVIFSTWDVEEAGSREAAEIIDPGEMRCGTFDGEGEGGKCTLPFDWKVGAGYQFELTETSSDDYTDSSLYLIDVANAKRIYLGTHRHAQGGKTGEFNAFTEDFHRDESNCWRQPERTMALSSPQVLGRSGWESVDRVSFSVTGKAHEDCRNWNAGSYDSAQYPGWFMGSAGHDVISVYADLENIPVGNED